MSTNDQYKSTETAELLRKISSLEDDIARRAGARIKMQAGPGDLTKVIDDPIARAAMAHKLAANEAQGMAMFDRLDQEATQTIAAIRGELKNRGHR